MNRPTFPDAARRVRIHEIARASSQRQYQFVEAERRHGWKHWLAVVLFTGVIAMLVCYAVAYAIWAM